MTFARGATLTTATTFGHADTSNLGPTAGNGFYKRWPDDLALLQELGLTDLRLTFDWARLQPKPGDLDGAWADRFEQMLAASDAIGLRVWATLHDGAEPRWISNEGGLGDDNVAEKWWPRYVERIADRFGEKISGWIPFSGVDEAPTADGWRNTWTTLDGSKAPVVASIGSDHIGHIADHLETSNAIGIVLEHGEVTDDDPGDERFAQMRERLQGQLVDAAEQAGDLPIIVSQFTPFHNDPDIAGRIVETLVEAVDATIADGVDIEVVFLDPAIAGPDSPNGLLGTDRAAQPASDAFLAHLDAG